MTDLAVPVDIDVDWSGSYKEPPLDAQIILNGAEYVTKRVHFAKNEFGSCTVHRAVSVNPEPDGSHTVLALKAVGINAAEKEIGVFADRHLPRYAISPRVIWRNDDIGQAILESPWCESTLDEQINLGRKFTTSESARIIAQTTVALRDAGLCHRDIKPENIFLLNNEAKLADWTLAVPHGSPDDRIGTLGFIPLECSGDSRKYIPSEQKTSFARDVFAIGMTATECMAGRTFNAWGSSYSCTLGARDCHNDPSFSDPWMRLNLQRMINDFPEDRIQDPLDVLCAMSFYQSTHDLFNDRDKRDIANHFLTWSRKGIPRSELLAISKTIMAWDSIDPEVRHQLEIREAELRQEWEHVRASNRDLNPVDQGQTRTEATLQDRILSNSRSSLPTLPVDFSPPAVRRAESLVKDDLSILCERAPPKPKLPQQPPQRQTPRNR